MSSTYAIAVHGGAGAVPRAALTPEREARYREGLERALDAGYALLEGGGSSLDAVTTAVRILEDDPLFNAGHGAALTRDGAAELDAAIMDGRQLRAGAVASVRHVRNPIELARRVMEKSRHVLLVGAGAEEFALEEKFQLVPNLYFRTAERVEQLEAEQRGARVSDLVPSTRGTVGAVARDTAGNLAAATSTGGMTNKRPGRVGDSPIIGAGTFADNASCAVSCTGIGEDFLRTALARTAAFFVEERGMPARDAAEAAIRYLTRKVQGIGGLILIDREGRCARAFSTPDMLTATAENGAIRVDPAPFTPR